MYHARHAREGRCDESIMENLGSKLKLYKIHHVGNHLLFRSRGRATRESTHEEKLKTEWPKIPPKLHAPRAWRARARKCHSREGRSGESTVENSGSKLKFYKIHHVGNHLLFRSRGRVVRELIYPRRKVENRMTQYSPTC